MLSLDHTVEAHNTGALAKEDTELWEAMGCPRADAMSGMAEYAAFLGWDEDPAPKYNWERT